MKKILLLITAVLLSGLPQEIIAQAQPQPTTVTVRARAMDAKFIGTSMGGAMVTITNAETGDILARGVTEGSTGDTGRLMNTPEERYMQLSTPGAAKFETTLQLSQPVFARIAVTAPWAQPQSRVTSTTQLWLIPGKDITGEGIILEVPGFSIDIVAPQVHERTGGEVTVRANVVMMCGCPTSPGGLWDSDKMEIRAMVMKGGETVATIPMEFTGKSSTFEGVFIPEEGGAYQVVVYGYDARTGNTGLDRTTVLVSR